MSLWCVDSRLIWGQTNNVGIYLDCIIIIAECISARPWMRDPFSQFTCIRMYMSVTLRIVTLKSRQGRISDTMHMHYTTLGRHLFLPMEDGEDSAAGPLQHTHLTESSAETSAEHSRRLATLTKNKTKRSVHHKSKESKKRTRKVQQ